MALAVGQAGLAGYCSAKGRLLASFVLWPSGPDDWWLACSADVLPATLKRLSMFVLRAKCRLTDVSASLALWGLAGDSARQSMGTRADGPAWSSHIDETSHVIRLPDAAGTPRWLVAQAAGAAAPNLPALDAGLWRWLEVHSGIVRIVAPTADHFVPQMVNFELVGGVSFTKGCYPGQEVVARSQYRGTVKRRAVLLSSVAALSEGQEVFHDADPGQPAGLVALAATRGAGEHLALVEIKRALLAQPGAFHGGAADGPALRPVALPYDLPTDGD
jgi:tRNA-modifying protein YgfZ